MGSNSKARIFTRRGRESPGEETSHVTPFSRDNHANQRTCQHKSGIIIQEFMLPLAMMFSIPPLSQPQSQ